MTALSRPMLAIAFAIVPVTLAHASLAITQRPTQNVTCADGVCSATASDAVLNAHQLTDLLASGAVTVKSTSVAGDIVVGTQFSWTSANTLTLDAFHSIVVRKTIVVAGPGGLTLKTNDGGSGGDYLFPQHGHVRFWDLSSALVINGDSYTLVTRLSNIAAKIAADPSGNYALAKSYKAGDDPVRGAAPIPTPLTGKFEGLGNAIERLRVTDTDPAHDVGLFLALGPGGVIRDLSLSASDFQTSAGQDRSVAFLVARNFGTLLHDKVSGSMAATAAGFAGSLTGYSGQGALIGDCSGKVTFSDPSLTAARVGGLVGFSDGTIASSHVFAFHVVGGNDSNIGGLLGENSIHGVVTDSSIYGSTLSTGEGSNLGGLVGLNTNLIVNSHAASTAIDAMRTGGLVGLNTGTILHSYAIGNGHISDHHGESGGGLVGTNAGTISESFATGHIDGEGKASMGGLAGLNTGVIQDSYAEGCVCGFPDSRNWNGGLVGTNQGTLVSSYSMGFVAGNENRIGGAVGLDSNPGGVSAVYWDTDTGSISDPSQGAAKPRNDPGIAARTSAQLRAGLPAGLSPAIWGLNASIHFGLPYLLAVPPPQ